ncbi:ArsR family transcriptional regulator [Prolixibacteraceae bacterium JC049]|nr:ArsR family transcriptional regulator [Prolixibacteraceae bacterium JC049]
MYYLNKYQDQDKQLARFAKALGHPVRIMILRKLSTSSCCYSGDMCEELPIARSTLSQHLKELKESGLIKGEVTPPRIKYCINKENWAIAQKLINEFFLKEEL